MIWLKVILVVRILKWGFIRYIRDLTCGGEGGGAGCPRSLVRGSSPASTFVRRQVLPGIRKSRLDEWKYRGQKNLSGRRESVLKFSYRCLLKRPESKPGMSDTFICN